MPDITPYDLAQCNTRSLGHRDGQDRDGRWFGDVEQIVEHPRITRMVQIWRKRTKPQETIWSLDGEAVGSIDAVVAAYNAKPVPDVSKDERILLQEMTGDWAPKPVPAIHLMPLRDKGLVEFNAERLCRRTELARVVLEASA